MKREVRMQKSVISNQRSVISSHGLRTPHSALRTSAGFTMIEIALSLAIIGFALIAIIGVLPIGMNTQKDNRESTIINQDATVWMNAIRNGDRVDDLTNYIMAITNYVTRYDQNMGHPVTLTPQGYTPTGSSTSPQFPLNTGLRIVGLLSTPKYIPVQQAKGNYVLSNHVVAYVRALSGGASEKFPQNSPAVQDFSFCYRMTSEVVPYYGNSADPNYYDPSWVYYGQPGLSTNDYMARYNNWRIVNTLQANLHDVRLLFRWPLRSRDQVGSGGQAYRTLAGGFLGETNEPGFPRSNLSQPSPYDLYLFQPRTYVQETPTP